MEMKIVNHGKVFDRNNWYTFYCGKCSEQIDMNIKPESCSCGEKIDYPINKGVK